MGHRHSTMQPGILQYSGDSIVVLFEMKSQWGIIFHNMQLRKSILFASCLGAKRGPLNGALFGTVPPFSIRFAGHGSVSIPLMDSPRAPFVGASPHTPIMGFRHRTVQLG
eukprot:scaffold5_cov98-Cylindrotheca_fusiformis.AAC.1